MAAPSTTPRPDGRGVVLGGCLTMTYFRAVYPALSSACCRFTVLFGMGRSGSSRLKSSGIDRPMRAASAGRQGGLGCVCVSAHALETHNYGVKPHGPLVPVSSTRYRASTPGLSTWWSATTLQGDQVPGRSHLQARFPLRCFQRLSLPYIATRRCDWRHNRYTSGTSTPVLSY